MMLSPLMPCRFTLSLPPDTLPHAATLPRRFTPLFVID